jgi:threonyl-tRNA synthetase
MLQRIYGTAWATKDELEAYLHMLEEAEKRDHRKLGRSSTCSTCRTKRPAWCSGTPRAGRCGRPSSSTCAELDASNGYQEVKTPQMSIDKGLWEKSGHWDNYQENMFTTQSEKRDYAVKPMNCPGHVQVFNPGCKSYRDLPMRYGRVRLLPPQRALGCAARPDARARLCAGRRAYLLYRRDKAEQGLRDALTACGLQWEELPGEGAFYGPKIEYHIKDAIGRSWQCGTLQLDFVLPERLDAEYVTEDNGRARPVMLHRAILGSLERFIGILIENHAGSFPLWLAPVQMVVMNITEHQADYCREVAERLRAEGFRVALDLRNEKIGYKIRDNSQQRFPYQIVVGNSEKENRQVAVRRKAEDLGSLNLDDFIARLKQEIALSLVH